MDDVVEVVEGLKRLLLTLPMIEAQRETIQRAIDALMKNNTSEVE